MADTDAGPNQGAPETNVDAGDSSTTTGTPSPHDVELARLNSENRKHRQSNKALQDEIDKLKQANASESEQAVMKARAEGEALYKARWRDAVVSNAAIVRLQEKGVVAADLALRVLDTSGVDVDLDTGRVADISTIDSQIEELAKRYPQLFAPPDQGKPGLPGINGNEQRRVTSEDLMKANDVEERNRLIRFALGR